jgi:exosortase D (VPLPA-CTERM-specific)
MSKVINGLVNDSRLRAATVLLIFVAAYWLPLKSMVHIWMGSEDYSYGFIIPVISAYIIWEKRADLQRVRILSSWKILPILVLMVALSIYGILGSSGNISMPAIPLLLILFTAFIFGIDAVKTLMLPLAFLIFMIPLPAVIERTLGMFLKSISTKLGGAFISACNISVHVSGNIIDLGTSQLQVVDACNGMRFLFPLMALGVVYAYFFERVTWKRIFCVIATLPIAVLTNGLRIGITGVLTNYFGKGAAEGFFHDFEGWVMFMVAFIFIFLLGRILRFFPPRHVQPPIAKCNSVSGRSVERGVQHTRQGAFYVSIALLAVVGALSLSTSALPAVKIQGGISGFPLTFGEWQGRSEYVDPKIVEASGAEESFSGEYANSKNKQVSLYVGYRSTAFLETENFFHSPTVCLPSSGWEVISTTTRKISGVPIFGELPVTEMLVDNMGNKLLVYFWFQTKSRATYDKNINRFHLTLHAISRENTYDLFMRPITQISKDESKTDAEARMDNYVRDMLVAMNAFLKDKAQ